VTIVEDSTVNTQGLFTLNSPFI